MICVTPLEKRTKRWKTLVATRGEAAAYSLYFKYQGEVPESEYVTPTGRYGDTDPFIKEKYFYDIPDGTPAKSSTILERISTSTHPLNKVAQHLLPYVDRINNSDIFLVETLDAAGVYDGKTNKIEINRNSRFRGKGVESSIIHEVMHSLTMGSILSNGEKVQELNVLYEYLKPMFPAYNEKTGEGVYALNNLDEFIVGLFSDSAFIKELIKIPALDKSKSSFLQEIFDYILSLFDISEEDSIYRQAFNIASNILEDAALYSEFQKEQYEMMYYNSPQANPNFAAQLKQWHDTKGSYFSNTEQQANDTYQRLVKFYTNAVVRRPYQTRTGKWVVTVKKPVDIVVEEDIKKVVNEGYSKDYKTEIVKVGENQWMTPEGDIISEADAQDLMRFRDVQAPESLPKFKPSTATDVFEYNQDFEKISKVLSNLDVNKTLLDFITPSTIESTLQNAGFSDEMVTQLTDFYNSNRDLMYSAPNIYEVVNAYVSSKIPFGRTEIVKRADKELESKLLKWLEPLNISVKDLNDFKKNLNVNALGIADIINKTIYLAKERQIDTLPEEVAHFYVEFLEKRNKKGQSRNYLLYDDLINKIESWSEYQKYYDEYSKIYTKEGIVNIEKVKKEIIGKAIAEAVVRRFETKDLGLYSLIQEVIDYLRSIFKSRPLLNIQSLADDIAEKILSEDYSDIKKDLSEDVKLRDYKSVPKEVRDIIHNISSVGATMTGSVALRKAGTVYREDGEEFHDLDFKVSPTIDRESFLNKIKKIYPSLTLKSEFQSGSSYTTLWNITVDGKIYDIDFFFETKPYNKLDNFVHWADTFAAKLDLGRAKDVTDFINYKPYKKFSLFPKKDVVIDDYLYYQTESLPKFKPIEYSFKSQEAILNNLDKIKSWEKQIKDPNILYRKIQELGIPKSQMELLINSDGNTVEEKLLSFLSNYSYTIEINTAKEKEGLIKDGTEFKVGEDYYYSDPVRNVYKILYSKDNGGGSKNITKEEFENARQNSKSTSYYSNLTVPGGTNYTENEIATPQIVPSIKGHGQFATDNGIGWFRSDDKSDNEPSPFEDEPPYGDSLTPSKIKTRRILEVQSDLFQKGRDKEELVKMPVSEGLLYKLKNIGVEKGQKFNIKGTWFEVIDSKIQSGKVLYQVENINNKSKTSWVTNDTIYKAAKDFYETKNSSNDFLSLLNKDNNWVTFFVKSIVQDSAKKGYEKVLFPSGNTASKVEGHTTLEEFKKQKEDRLIKITKEKNTLNENLKQSDNYIKNTLNWSREGILGNIEEIDTEINQLKQELERVEREGFGALKPIYNFYENTVANVLKKQGYKPVVITDEYGNTWNEVNVLEITPENLIPKFKPKPANALNSLEVEQFRSALETSLQVGGTINFNYWSEGTSGEISNKDIEVLSVEDNTFVGRYPDGEERVFRFDNVVSKAIPGKYEVHEQVYFKSNLAVGKTINVTSNGLEYSGTVAEIGGDNFTILDPDGTMYTLKYADLDKENYERRIFQRASEMKSLLEEQIQRFSKNAKSKFQLDRIALLQQAVAQLDTYSGSVDLIKFMKLLQESVFKSKALMKTLSESEKDLDSMSESEKIEEVNRRLSKLSFLKDYVDSMMAFKKMAFEIAESDSSQELKDKAGGLALEIDSADNMYYEVAIPNIADWLWMCFPKKLNSQLLLIGEKEWTKERLIQELRQPTKDLDFLNSYGVPVANANDVITGLFSKAIKKVLQYAKINHINLEKNLLPFFKKVQATGAKMEEVYKKFYTIKQMETEEEVIVDGQPTIQKVIKNVRVFIEKYDLQSYYDTVRNFTSQIRALNDRIAVTDNTSERNALFAEKKKILAALTAYQKKTAINYSATQMNEMMEKLNKSNPSKFLDNLKFYTAGEETANSFKYTTEDGAVVYYNYKGNFYKPNKEAIDPDTGRKIFLTEDYENLMKESQEVIDLYNEVKRIYDEKNNMLPEHLKMKGVVPVFYEQSMLKDLSKTISNRGKYNDAQELRKKDKKTFTKLNGEPYQNVPLGYTKILDVSESSDNIMQSFLLWANDVQMFKAKNDVIGSVENLTTVLEKNRPLGEKGEGKSKINRRVEVIKKYANQVLYGETRASNEWWDRVFDYMGKFTALTRMLIKPSSALNNLIIGNYALLSEAVGGRNFTTKELWRAHKKYVDLVANNKEKLNNMLITLDAIQGRFKDEIGTDFQTLQDTFGFNTAFSLNNLAEHQIQAVSMLALLEKWGVEIPENGMFEVDKLPDNFLGTLHELNKANNGVYSESDRLYHQDESLFRLFLQFRKYIVPTFRTKWSGMTQKGNDKYRMDLEAGTIELGYYRAFGEFVWNNVVKIKNLPNLIANYNSLNEIEKEGVWRGLVDGVAFASIGLLFLPLAGADDDDWDDGEHSQFENLIHWELIYQLARLRADIGTYIPGFGFSDQSRLVNQPFAAASTATQLAKIVGIVFDFEEDDEGNISIWKQYERDYGRFKKGDLKILQPISKLNPLDNPYEDLFPHVQYNDFKGASR